MDAPFPRGRYPTSAIRSACQNATYENGVLSLLVEPIDPVYPEPIQITGITALDDAFLDDLLEHIEAFDDDVQSFCEESSRLGKGDARDGIVELSWIDSKNQTITMGYWGTNVNVELRAIYTRDADGWKRVDIYYQ